jgi:hypothetical protein
VVEVVAVPRPEAPWGGVLLGRQSGQMDVMLSFPLSLRLVSVSVGYSQLRR